MEEDLCGYMDWITQAEDMDELDEDGNPRKAWAHYGFFLVDCRGFLYSDWLL